MNEEVIAQLNPVIDREISAVDQEYIYERLSEIDGIMEFFRWVMNNDMKLHFTTSKENQDMVRGGYNRTMHFYKKVGDVLRKKASEKQN